MFAGYPGVETASAGLAPDADELVTPDHLEWAELIVVMEAVHRRRLQRDYAAWLRNAKVAVLDVPDDFDFMDPELVDLLKRRVPPLLRRKS